MSKLWIVHRNPHHRRALARIAGRAATDCASGGPDEADFAEAADPKVLVLGVAGDFERELDFVHRLGGRLRSCSLILLADRDDHAEVARLFRSARPEVLEALPSPRVLRETIADALAQRRVESLAARKRRDRIAERFSAWFGHLEIPGLLRALDPALDAWPLLVRGLPGSGRTLLTRYVDLFRPSAQGANVGAPVLRLHASEIASAGELARRLASFREDPPGAQPTIRIDEVDSLPASAQIALASWISHETSPRGLGTAAVRWVATAGPPSAHDALEPALERAFAPLILEIPRLDEAPDAIAPFAMAVAREWSKSVGGPVREVSAAALAEFTMHPWQGDRAELEARLREILAATNRNPIEPADLQLEVAPASAPGTGTEESDAQQDLSSRTSETRPEEARTQETRTRGFPTPEPPTEALADIDALIEPNAIEDLAAPFYLDPSSDETETPDEDVPVVEWIVEDDEEEQEADDGMLSSGDWIDVPDAGASAEDREDDGGAEIDESVLLSDASFALADSDEIGELAPAVERAETGADSDSAWRRLARSLSHEIRNPLVSIKTFAELLPEHYEDETFRARFADLVGRDVAHISDVVTRMQDVAERDDSVAEATDVSVMLEELLEERRERITERRLLVLRELERDAPLAWAEPVSLRVALAGLIDRALDSLPERGDLFVATRHVNRGPSGEPRLRILMRHHNPNASPSAGSSDELSPESNVLEYVLAETIARSFGGSLTVDSSGTHESLILLELRTPN